jgi:hypothetical protein
MQTFVTFIVHLCFRGKFMVLSFAFLVEAQPLFGSVVWAAVIVIILGLRGRGGT